MPSSMYVDDDEENKEADSEESEGDTQDDAEEGAEPHPEDNAKANYREDTDRGDDQPVLTHTPYSSGRAAPDKHKQMAAYLRTKYGTVSNLDAVKAAQDQAREDQEGINRMHGIETMFRARAEAHGGQGVDDRYYDSLHRQAQIPVGEAQAERAARIQDYLTEQKLGVQANQQALAAQANDPGSRQAQVARAAFKANFPDTAATMGADFDSLTPTDIAGLSKMTDAKARNDTAMQVAMMRRDTNKARLADASDRKKDEKKASEDKVSLKNATDDLKGLGKDLDNQTASSRSGLGDATKRVNGADRLMTFADTSPDELDAAKNDPKAKAALVGKFNKMSPQQYSEVVTGLMSQVSPGSSSLGQFEHLRAQTADQTKANLMQYFTSNPEAANAGPLIYNNMMTLKNERDTSQKVLESHVKKMKSKHPLAFKHDSTSSDAQAMMDAFATPEPTGTGSGGAVSNTAQAVPGQPTLQDVQAEMARRKAQTQSTAGK